MAQGIPEEVMMNAALIKDLADVAKDAALLQGVLMRIQETPNSSEVRNGGRHFKLTNTGYDNTHMVLLKWNKVE